MSMSAATSRITGSGSATFFAAANIITGSGSTTFFAAANIIGNAGGSTFSSVQRSPQSLMLHCARARDAHN